MISNAVQELLGDLEGSLKFGFIKDSFFRDVAKAQATLTSQESTSLLHSLLNAKNNFGHITHSTTTFIKLISLIVDLLDRSTVALTSQEYTALLYGLLECLRRDNSKKNQKIIFSIIVDLLDRGADVQQRTPFLSVYDDSLIQLFLEKRADPNQRDADQKMSLMNSNIGPAGLKLLLESGADPNAQDKDGNSPLFYQTEKPQNLRLLLEVGADVNHRNQEGITALIWCARREDDFNQKSIEVLLQHGADPNIADHQGKTVLMHLNLKSQRTSNSDKSAALKALVAAGADIHQRTPDGMTLLQHYLASHYRGKYNCECSCAIALLNLKVANQQVNIPDGLGQHPLNYLALYYSDEKFKSNWRPNQPAALIQALLNNGADPNFADNNGETPLMFWSSKATLKLSKKVVTLMLNAGADANRTDYQGRTALMHAAKNNNVATVRALLPQTAIPNARCQQGYSCLEYALTHPDWPQNGVIPALIHGGVHINSPNGSTTNSLNLLGKVIATGDCDYAVELLQQGAKINQSTLQTLQIKAQELTDKARHSQIMTPMEESFIALARMQPELLLSALDCGDTGQTEQLRRLVEIVTSESQDSALFQKLLSPWPPHFAQPNPLIVDSLNLNPPAPDVYFSVEERTEFGRYQAVLDSWINSDNYYFSETVIGASSSVLTQKKHQRQINNVLLAQPTAIARLWNETVWKQLQLNFDGTLYWKESYNCMYHGSEIKLDALKYLVWRCGAEVVPGMLKVAEKAPYLVSVALSPVADIRVVPLMMGMIDEQVYARHWFSRHLPTAVHGMLPVALGTLGPVRNNYEQVLRRLASEGHGSTIRDIAATYSSQVVDAVDEILSVDRASDFHRQKLPNMPLWILNGQYHLLLEKGTGTPLPGVYLQRLLEMMSLSTHDDVYPPLLELLDLLDRQSLAEFGWSVFQVWNEADSKEKNKHKWMLYCLGYLADGSISSRLVAAMNAWSTTFGARIVIALRVLTQIGDDVAIRALYGFQNSKFSQKSVKKQAKHLLDHIALTRNISVKELQDQMVPTFDLDKPETLQLNFGSRMLTIGINEKLVPALYDHQGKKQKSLPKARKDDDATLAKAATERWRQLKAGLKKAASSQLPRLEQAMVTKRQWSSEEFNRYLSGHPLLRYVVKSLIWCAVWDEQPECYFRINDNGEFIDAADCPVVVSPVAQIFLPHPINMGEFVGLWKDSLVRNHMKQPFTQITRQTYRKEDDIHQDLFGIQGAKAPTKGFRGLKTMGWVPQIEDNGNIYGYNKKLSSGSVHIGFDGVVTMYDEGMDEDQTLEVSIPDSLTSIEFSEVLREVKGLLH